MIYQPALFVICGVLQGNSIATRSSDRCAVLTLLEMQRRFRVWCQKFAAEKFASKMFGLHKSAISCHSYFIRAKLEPFCERRKQMYRQSLNLFIHLFKHFAIFPYKACLAYPAHKVYKQITATPQKKKP